MLYRDSSIQLDGIRYIQLLQSKNIIKSTNFYFRIPTTTPNIKQTVKTESNSKNKIHEKCNALNITI